MAGKQDYPAGPKGNRLNDYFGLNMSDGDRYGEIIPSMFAWMPPDELRGRVEYLEEISENLTLEYQRQKKKGGKGNGQKK
ncbi:MAG: hypothetical protein ACOYEK_08680 [bacterium]|jgi:hypothetical protein